MQVEKADDRKIFVIDTSVLLYDMTAIHAFGDNDVVLPIEVLDELDKFKEKSGILGESARYVNRFLDSLRSKGNLAQGVTDPVTRTNYRVVLDSASSLSKLGGLNVASTDNRIIAGALQMANDHHDRQVTLVTKDINLRVKCDALGISAEDYYNDIVDFKDRRQMIMEAGPVNLTGLTDEQVSGFHSTGAMTLDEEELAHVAPVFFHNRTDRLIPNTLAIGKSCHSSASFIGKTDATGLRVEAIPKIWKDSLKPRDKEQSFALWALSDAQVPLVTITGVPGSGKTFMALMTALNGLGSIHSRIVITRSLQPVGRDMGFLPGDVREKMAPWLSPIMDNFRHAFDDMTYFNAMIDKGQIEIAPLAYIRGRSFHDAFIIVDEAQNATIHELKTVLTRVGTGSKVVLLGDTDQIDTPYIDKLSNGLSIVIERFKGSAKSAHVHLSRGHRSDLANEASELL